MRTFLDDELVATDGRADTLDQAMDLARRRAQTLGRVIVQAWADGARVPDGDLGTDHAAETPAPYAAELRFVTESPRTLVSTAIRDVAEAMPTLQTMQRQAADHFTRGETIDAVERLREVLGLWDSVRRVLHDGGALLGTPLDTHPAVAPLLPDLTLRLNEVRRLMQEKDWAGLADELAYDLSEHASAWRGGLASLGDSVA